MQPFVRPLFLLHSSAELEGHLRLAAEAPLTLFRVSDWRALREALKRAPPAAVCVAEPFGSAGEGGGLSEDLRDVVRGFPAVTVVAAFAVHPGDAALLQTLYAWGVADVLDLAREDSPVAVARRLGEVRGFWVQRLLARALPRTTPSRARAMLAVAAEVVADGGQVHELAAALRVDERTVPRWCRRADLPPPRRLLAWLRMLLVAQLLDEPRRSVESVARACGYAGSASLNQTVRRFLRLTPRELRGTGAFQQVSEMFRRELFTLREQARARGRADRTWLN